MVNVGIDQSLRKDFNPELTRSKVLHYNNKDKLVKYKEDQILDEIKSILNQLILNIIAQLKMVSKYKIC